METGIRQLACLQLEQAGNTFQFLAREDTTAAAEAAMLWREGVFWRGIISEDKEELKAAIAKLQARKYAQSASQSSSSCYIQFALPTLVAISSPSPEQADMVS